MKTTLPTAEQIALDWRTTRAGTASSATTAPKTWCACAAPWQVEHSLARRGAEKLWKSLHNEDFVNALGALTGNQAMQQVKAGLQAIYLSGWQVAADANMPARCIRTSRCIRPTRCPRSCAASTTRCSRRPNPVHHGEKATRCIDFFAPIVADAEAGFGGVLNAFELMKAMIEAGAAGVHFEDQLASVKKCGHMGGKVLVPTREAVDKLAPRAWRPTSWACRPCWSPAPTPKPPTC